MHSIILILVNVIDQSACSDNLLHEGRKRLSFELSVLRLVGDDTGIEIDFDTGIITDKTQNRQFKGQAFPPFMQKIIAAGGLINYINED